MGPSVDDLVLEVPQGIGDAFWVYQKFAPYVKEIHLDVCVTDPNSLVQRRSLEFLKLLPKVKSVGMVRVTKEEYAELARYEPWGRVGLILGKASKGKTRHRYACNALLEKGYRLDQLDAEYPHQESVDLGVKLESNPHPYLLVYVSGSGPRPWSPVQWRSLVIELLQKHPRLAGVERTVLLGAGYDQEFTDKVEKEIRSMGRWVMSVIDFPAMAVLSFIKNASFFLGYQSGLSVLADQLSVPQLMIYFPHLRHLTHSWPVERNMRDGIYQCDFFSRDPKDVAADAIEEAVEAGK